MTEGEQAEQDVYSKVYSGLFQSHCSPIPKHWNRNKTAIHFTKSMEINSCSRIIRR